MQYSWLILKLKILCSLKLAGISRFCKKGVLVTLQDFVSVYKLVCLFVQVVGRLTSQKPKNDDKAKTLTLTVTQTKTKERFCLTLKSNTCR